MNARDSDGDGLAPRAPFSRAMTPPPRSAEDSEFLSALNSALGETDDPSQERVQHGRNLAADQDVSVRELLTSQTRSDVSLRHTTMVTMRAIAAYREVAHDPEHAAGLSGAPQTPPHRLAKPTPSSRA